MYENETYDVILRRMLDRVSDKLDKRESSPVWDTHSATAIELQILYIELDTLIKNSYGDTAGREFLILLCKDRGITPDPATNAVLKGVFTPTTIDVTGKRFSIGDMSYVVIERMKSGLPGEYQVKCETQGMIGNQYLGQMIPIEYINGLETAELTEILIPGEDEEETETLRQRYYDSFDGKAFGGNRADYFSKVRSISGVGGVKITRAWNGDIRPADMIPTAKVTEWYQSVIDGLDEEVALWLSTVYMAAIEKKLTVGGTVLITIIDSDDYGEASPVLIESVQNTLDPEEKAGEGYGIVPIGHIVNVKSATPITIDVTTTLTFEEGYSWSNLSTMIKEAVNAYLLELRKTWDDTSYSIIRISQIESKILSIKGVIDVANTKLNGSTSNLTLGEYEIPVIGGVSA